MVRKYIFNWYETKDAKYGDPIKRTNRISLSHPVGDTATDAKVAVDLFTKNFGNLKKNTILSIKECDENGQIGEDIVPSTEENAIIPMRK